MAGCMTNGYSDSVIIWIEQLEWTQEEYRTTFLTTLTWQCLHRSLASLHSPLLTLHWLLCIRFQTRTPWLCRGTSNIGSKDLYKFTYYADYQRHSQIYGGHKHEILILTANILRYEGLILGLLPVVFFHHLYLSKSICLFLNYDWCRAYQRGWWNFYQTGCVSRWKMANITAKLPVYAGWVCVCKSMAWILWETLFQGGTFAEGNESIHP